MELIAQISLRGSAFRSRGFTCEAFCAGEVHSLSGTGFAPIYFTGEITGVERTGTQIGVYFVKELIVRMTRLTWSLNAFDMQRLEPCKELRIE